MKQSLISDGQLFNHYKQNEQSPQSILQVLIFLLWTFHTATNYY